MSERHIDFNVNGPDDSVSTDYSVPTSTSLELLGKAIKDASKTSKTENDPVNHPKHYTSSKRNMECIDAILACVDSYVTTPDIAWLVGQVIKYLWRAPLKGKMSEDLHKAQFYMNRIIKEMEK